MLSWCLSPVRVAGGRVGFAGSLARHWALHRPARYSNDRTSAKQSPSHSRIPLQQTLMTHAYSARGAVVTSFSDVPSSNDTCNVSVSSARLGPSSQQKGITRVQVQDGILSGSRDGVADAVQEYVPASKVARSETSSSGDMVPLSRATTPSPCMLSEDFFPRNDDQWSTAFLRRLLSQDIALSPSLFRLNAHRIRGWYLSAKARSTLSLLSPQEMSSLVSLFGSLSLSTPQDVYRGIHGHPLTAHMPKNSFRRFWSFVAQINKDKHRLGQTLNHSDRYWAMRANLAELDAFDEESHDNEQDDPAEYFLSMARQNYRHIFRYSMDFNVHYPYLRALLARPSPGHIHEMVPQLCKLIVHYETCNIRLLELFWHVVLRPADELRGGAKGQLLVALWQRQRDAVRLRLLRPAAQERVFNSTELSRRLSAIISNHSVDVKDLVVYLRHALFSRQIVEASQDPYHQRLSHWATSLTQTVFSPHIHSAETRWQCLVLLALYSSRLGSNGGNAVAHGGRTTSAAIADWHAICGLASLQNLFRLEHRSGSGPLDPKLVQGISRLLEALWTNWTTAAAYAPHQPAFVARAICVAFLQFAGRLQNRALGEACRRYCDDTADLWASAATDPNSSIGLRSLAQEYFVLRLGYGARVETALAAIATLVRCPQMLSAGTDFIISRLSFSDVESAQALWVAARQMEIVITADTVTSLAVALCRRGHYDAALRHLEEGCLAPHQQLEILRPLLHVMAQHRRWKSSPGLGRVGNVLKELPPSSLSSAKLGFILENALMIMLRSAHAANAVAIMERITSVDPSYFRQSFFTSSIRLLLCHRQFNLTEQVFELSVGLYPRLATLMQRQLVFRLSREGAGRLATRMAIRHPGAPLQNLDVLSLATYCRPRTSLPRVLSLKIERALHKHRSQVSPYTLNLFLRLGRVRAAKRLYKNALHQPQGARTAMGNDILHASLLHPSRRHARRMRKVLATLDELVRQGRFAPDRVTVNVLMKALMWWTAGVDGEKLRVLFDRMVQSGYPARGAGPPFGTEGAPAPQGFEIPQMRSGMSFVRHVRPLYKMFIKAFYVRGDVVGARTVVRILNAVETEWAEALELRERALRDSRRRMRRKMGRV